MIFWKRLLHPDDHLQKASPTWWSFARGQSILMIICKRPIHPDDHLQDAGTSSWSFARGRSILMILNDVLNLLSPIRCTNHNGVFVWVISERKRQDKIRQILTRDWLIRTPLIVKSNNPLSLVGSKGRPQLKKNVFFRALPESPKPPPHNLNSGNLVLFFRKSKFKIWKSV